MLSVAIFYRLRVHTTPQEHWTTNHRKEPVCTSLQNHAIKLYFSPCPQKLSGCSSSLVTGRQSEGESSKKKLSNSIFIPSPHIGFEHVDENCGLKSLLPRSWRLLTTTTTTAFFSSFAHCSFQSRLKPFKKSGPKQARESSVFRRFPLYRYAPAPEEMRKCLGFPLRHSLTPASV